MTWAAISCFVFLIPLSLSAVPAVVIDSKAKRCQRERDRRREWLCEECWMSATDKKMREKGGRERLEA
jgi:hypothetical protein